MATIIQRDIFPEGGMIIASVSILSKDPNDDFLARKYGDVYINPSGSFADPQDATFQFIVDSGNAIGILLSNLPDQKINATFNDETIDISIRLRQANLWSLSISNAIAAGITKLRTDQDSISGNYTMTV